MELLLPFHYPGSLRMFPLPGPFTLMEWGKRETLGVGLSRKEGRGEAAHLLILGDNGHVPGTSSPGTSLMDSSLGKSRHVNEVFTVKTERAEVEVRTPR